jgi:hypothetical protein
LLFKVFNSKVPGTDWVDSNINIVYPHQTILTLIDRIVSKLAGIHQLINFNMLKGKSKWIFEISLSLLSNAQ